MVVFTTAELFGDHWCGSHLCGRSCPTSCPSSSLRVLVNLMALVFYVMYLGRVVELALGGCSWWWQAAQHACSFGEVKLSSCWQNSDLITTYVGGCASVPRMFFWMAVSWLDSTR